MLDALESSDSYPSIVRNLTAEESPSAPETPIKSSYAALVNPEDGNSLYFIRASLVNGRKCPKITAEDVAPEIDYWQSTVLCTVLGANLPLEIIEGFIRRIWSNYAIEGSATWLRYQILGGNEFEQNWKHDSQVQYLNNALSDHTPLMLHLTDSPKPKRTFQFCEMWISDISFMSLVQALFPKKIYNPSKQLQGYLVKTQQALLKLNKDKYHDLRNHQVKAREVLEQVQQEFSSQPNNTDLKQKEKEVRDQYISITSSIMDIIRQQSKAEWIHFGDANTKYFFAKAKQRKLESYVYAI
ncbi:hypothetical protein Cgig2_021615 [Carnegiea gigantea]|uniref:Uncharacterized protein n=1 Tax=Carnegiea gigantea TaxID=171969 RepID=A0A9Q1JE30_9CARY|nr:hypothetical protein Cgig2_021615 [Carnegiea gigantea]